MLRTVGPSALLTLLLFLFLSPALPAQDSGSGLSGSGVSGHGETRPAEPLPDLVLSFTGDLMAHSINYGMKDYREIYRNLNGLLLEDDLTFGNVEFPMDPSRPMASFPSFNIHPAYVQAFIDAGLDVFSLANNHIADIGLGSLFATRHAAETLAAENPRPLFFSGIAPEPESGASGGTGSTPAAAAGSSSVPSPGSAGEADRWSGYPVTEISSRGWKIGFLAVSQSSNNPVSREYLYQVDYTKPEQTEIFLDWLREVTGRYDLFILSYHGGVEYNFLPAPGKQRFFRELTEAGVDIVWGQHPHVLQPVELRDSPRGTGTILYSMGNFLSGQGRIIDETLPEEEWSYTGDSAIIRLTVGRDGERGITVRNIRPVPVANYITPSRDVIL